MDPSFVAIVPLGGRHVQHFWRLLNGLSIPFATLLDLDLGRNGGGYGRIKTAIGHLIEQGVPRERPPRTWTMEPLLTEEQFAEMHTWTSDEDLPGWIDVPRTVTASIFSQPLDLDMAMLAAYPKAYEATIPTGRRTENEAQRMRPKPFSAKAAPGSAPTKTRYPGFRSAHAGPPVSLPHAQQARDALAGLCASRS